MEILSQLKLTDAGGPEEGQERELSEEGGIGWGPARKVRLRVLGEGGGRKLLVLQSRGNLARNCLVMGAREAKQWQDFSKTWGKAGEWQGVR